MNATARPEGLGLPRFLAVILGGFAVPIGLFAAIGLFESLSRGEWKPLGGAAGGGLAAWTLGWLATVLWSGRMIPRWFLGAFFGGIVGLALLEALVSKATWAEFLGLVGMLLPAAWQFRSVLRNGPAAPKPSPLGDFD